ncbi:conserved membrane hypothetical protein [metagenome]|uniref:DUF4231 domain-containing protein n=1 Tax=metagenome TaxID=256318 RepID=A0A2P2C7H8_9ZZZZ
MAKARLGGLLIAALGAAVAISIKELNVGGIVAFVAFVAALIAELYGALVRPEKTWYEGRAAAESTKTLAWRYAVRGESFESGLQHDVDRAFLRSLTDILRDLGDLNVTVGSDTGEQITRKMREARLLSFEERRALYLESRILDQQTWYSNKSGWNERRAHAWLLAGIAFEGVGVLGAALIAFFDFDVDLLGIAAAGAATAAAWVQTKQYQNLATAYGVTAQELSSVASEVSVMKDEESWARLVGESEEAISREHTLWRASRGLGLKPHPEKDL